METSEIKVLHISCYDIGGAAKAALRLHNELMREGVDSKFLCLDKYTDGKNVFQFNKQKHLNLMQRGLKKIGFYKSNTFKNNKRIESYKGEYELFTFGETDINILDCKLVSEADIINLHWIARYVNYPSFFKNINKPIVWTLHDKNPALGGFHLLVDKERNPAMLEIENEVAEKKRKWINQYDNISVVSPSKFLMNYSKSSKSLNRYPHYYIPNAVDLSVFKPQDKASAKKAFDLPEKKKAVLFFNDTSFHKGSDMVWKCIRTGSFSNIHFVALGDNEMEQNEEVTFINFTKDERSLSLLYAAADAFLLPTREDNLPNMMLESLACGTPVLATPIGGIIDTIENGFNGFISKDVSVEAIREMLVRFDNEEFNFDSDKIRSFAVERFSPEMQSGKYIKLYKNILTSAS